MLSSIILIRKTKTNPVNEPIVLTANFYLIDLIYKLKKTMTKPDYAIRVFKIGLFLFLSTANSVYADKLESALSIQKKTIDTSRLSQNKINDLDDKTRDLAIEYRATLHKTNSLKIYNAQLEKVISSQKTEIDSLDQQLKDIDKTQEEIIPLILKMLNTLESFIQLDTPFLVTERRARVQALRKVMDRADITVSEKYRRVIEAYQIETEYGRTIEAYEGSLPASETRRMVELLRVGRLGLYYLALDGNEAGFWNKNSKSWVMLDNRFRRSISDGILIARKQAAPDLLSLPVSFMEQP